MRESLVPVILVDYEQPDLKYPESLNITTKTGGTHPGLSHTHTVLQGKIRGASKDKGIQGREGKNIKEGKKYEGTKGR